VTATCALIASSARREIADVDAIHPGYGFLSENSKFAEQCESCKIRFIGPKSQTIKIMGDKSVARQTVAKAGVPTVPGSDGPVDSESEAIKVARKIGYPIIIKAVAGGGGRGMRIAHNDVSFAKEYHVAGAEAEKSIQQWFCLHREIHPESQAHRVSDPRRCVWQRCCILANAIALSSAAIRS